MVSTGMKSTIFAARHSNAHIVQISITSPVSRNRDVIFTTVGL